MGEPVRTTPPGRFVLLYDGDCAFCERQSARLVRWAKDGQIERRSFRSDGVLDAFPGISIEQCEEAMALVAPDGSVTIGAHAAVEALGTRTSLRLFERIYTLPLVRPVADAVYRVIARFRFLLGGRTTSCESGTCNVHDQK